jgi:hypothetical protein
MKDIHHDAIKYLTYLVLNKRKLDNKQTPGPRPNKLGLLVPHQNPPRKGGITKYIASQKTVINARSTGSYSCQCVNIYGR